MHKWCNALVISYSLDDLLKMHVFLCTVGRARVSRPSRNYRPVARASLVAEKSLDINAVSLHTTKLIHISWKDLLVHVHNPHLPICTYTIHDRKDDTGFCVSCIALFPDGLYLELLSRLEVQSIWMELFCTAKSQQIYKACNKCPKCFLHCMKNDEVPMLFQLSFNCQSCAAVSGG